VCSSDLGMDRVANHREHLEGHHDLVILDEITGEEKNAFCSHDPDPVVLENRMQEGARAPSLILFRTPALISHPAGWR